jgi:hypothetical protein
MALRLSLVIDGDSTGAQKAVEDTSKAVDTLSTAAARATGGLQGFDAGIEIAATDAMRLSEAAAGASGSLATTGPAAAKGAGEAQGAVKLTTQQLQNLSFQVNDLATGLASGQSPFLIIAQQGAQIIQLFGPGVGVGAALRAVGTGITSFLLNPLTLTLAGFTAAAAGAEYFFNEVLSSSNRVERALAAQRDLVKEIGDSYTRTGRTAQAFGLISQQGQLLAAGGQLDTLERETAEQTQALADLFDLARGGFTGTVGQSALQTQFGPFADRVEQFIADVKAGKGDVLSFSDQVARIANQSADASVRAFAQTILSMTKDAVDSAGGLAKAEAAVRVLQGTASNADRALLGLSGGLTNAGQAAGAQLGSLREFDALLASIGSRSPALAPRLRLDAFEADVARARQMAQDLGLPPAQTSELLGKLDQYATSARPFVNPPPPAPKPVRAPAAASPESVATGGATEFRDMVDAINEEIASLKIEAETYGMSEEAAAAYRKEQELLAAAQRDGIAVTPELTHNIDELAGAFGHAQGEIEELRQKTEAFDELRAASKGFLSDLVGGLREGKSWTEALGGALSNLADKFIDKGEDWLINALFGAFGGGTGGNAGGFDLGSLLKSIFGFAKGAVFAAADGAVVTKPTYFSYGAGALGVMGEAGPEAIMPLRLSAGAYAVGAVGNDNRETTLPLTRLSSGALGVAINAKPTLAAADGAVMTKPTELAQGAGGALGIMAEARPEAIMPLRAMGGSYAVGAIANDNRETALPIARLSSGALGVRLHARPFALGDAFAGSDVVSLSTPVLTSDLSANARQGNTQRGDVTNIYVQGVQNPKAFAEDRFAVMRGANRLAAQTRRHN